MSYVLHLFHDSDVETVEQATHRVYDDEPPHDPADAARFAALSRDLALVFEDAGADGAPGALWPEGVAPPGDDVCWNLAIASEHATPGLLSAVGALAARADLHLLDPQLGILFRRDFRVVQGDQVFKLPTRIDDAGTWIRPPATTPVEAAQAIGRALASRLPDFTLHATDEAAVLWRRMPGGVRQAIALQGAPGLVGPTVQPVLMLSHPDVAEAWAAGLPQLRDWKWRMDQACGGEVYAFQYGIADWLAELDRHVQASFERSIILAPDDAVRAAHRLGDLVNGPLKPLLARVKDLKALAKLALTPDAIAIMATGRVSLPEQLGSLATAALAAPQLYEDVARALVGNRRKWEYWGALDDPRGEMLDALVIALRG